MMGFDKSPTGNEARMAVDHFNTSALEPVVILGLLNSMSVVLANTETLLGNWDALSEDGESARIMLERVSAHARVVTDALELAARELPPTLIAAMLRPEP